MSRLILLGMYCLPGLLLLSLCPNLVQQPEWQPASPWGMNNGGENWSAGRVVDVAELTQDQLLVASDTSGVWLLTRNTGTPLSMQWNTNTVTSLAKDPRLPMHVYAAGTNSTNPIQGILYETNTSVGMPLLAPWREVPVPPGAGPIRKVLVLQSSPKIVIATSNGVYWAPVPASGIAPSWTQAVMSSSGAVYDLEEGPNGRIIASGQYTDTSRGQWPIRYGDWRADGSLQFAQASLRTDQRTTPTSSLRTTSVGVCAGNRNIMYAICSDSAGAMKALLKSEDAGQTWRPRPGNMPPDRSLWHQNEKGRQGLDRNNCIAVSPSDPNKVAVGWVHAYFSADGGETFRALSLHDDHAAVQYVRDRLYDCSDGGIAVSSDDGLTFDFRFNRKLANLQFYGHCADVVLGARSVMSGGLQDNDNVYAVAALTGGFGPWKFFVGPFFDGGPTTILPNQGIAWARGGGEFAYSPSEITRYGSGTTIDFSNVPAADITVDPTTGSRSLQVIPARLAKVVTPRARLRNETIVAFGAKDTMPVNVPHEVHLYAMVVASSGTPKWYLHSRVPTPANETCTAIGSYDGSEIYLGYSTGRIVKLASTGGMAGPVTTTVTVQNGLPSTGYAVEAICTPSATSAMAISNATGSNSGSVYVMSSPNNWRTAIGAPSTYLRDIVATSPTQVYVATDNQVFRSRNNLDQWEVFSTGLPRWLSAGGLMLARDVMGRRWLSVSTWGWSMWKVQV